MGRHRTYNHIPISGTCLTRSGKIPQAPQSNKIPLSAEYHTSNHHIAPQPPFHSLGFSQWVVFSDLTERFVMSDHIIRHSPHQIQVPHTRSQPDMIKSHRTLSSYRLIQSLLITSCHCTVYSLLRSVSHQQYIPYHYITLTVNITIIFLWSNPTQQEREQTDRNGQRKRTTQQEPYTETITQKKKRYISTASLSFYA